MRGGRQGFEHGTHRRRQAAHALQFVAVEVELRERRQLSVNEQMRDLLEFTGLGDLEDVVAAIVQIVASAPHAREGGVARRYARKGNGFFGFERCLVHLFSSPNSASSLRS